MVHNYENRINRVRGETTDTQQSNVHDNLTERHRDLLRQWDDQLQLEEKSPATRAGYLELLSHFLRETDLPVDEIGRKEVNAFLASKNGLRTYKGTLPQFFLWYYRDHEQRDADAVPAGS